MRRSAFALLLCAALATGCADQRAPAQAEAEGPPVRGGTLEIVGRSDVDHLSTTSATYNPTLGLFRTFTRQLLAFPPEGDYAAKTRLAPDLAIEVPTKANGGISADGLTYTFHLRPGVRWDSDPPRPVTAHDVVRAMRLLCNPVSQFSMSSWYTSTIVGMAAYCDAFARVPGTVASIREFVTTHDLEGVRALDDATVVFRLRTTAPDFINLVALPVASPVPVEYLDYLPDSPEFRQHTRSDGPYRIVRYVPNHEMLLERNPAWDPGTDQIRRAFVDRIRIRLGLDAQKQQQQIEAGTADVSFDELVPTAELGSLLAIDEPMVALTPPGDIYGACEFLVFNHVGPNNGGALKRLGVRRAIALAVDKAAIVQLLGGPRVARPLRQAVASSVTGFRSGADRDVTPSDRGDSAGARRLLAEAGYPHGVTLRLAYPSFGWMPLAAQSVQASLLRVGLDVRLLPMLPSDYWGRLLTNPEHARRGEWDLAFAGWSPPWFGENNGRSVIAALFDGRQFGQNTSNFGGYSSREVDALIDRATTANTTEMAEEAWFLAARHLMDDVALVPLVEYKAALARSRRVRNWTWEVYSVGSDLTAMWLADAAPNARGAR